MLYFYGLQLMVWPWFITWLNIIYWVYLDSTQDFEQQYELRLWIGNIHSQGASTVPSLAIFSKGGQKILSRQYFFKDQQFDLDVWPRDLKINRHHLLPRGAHCTNFGHLGVKRYSADKIFLRPAVWPWHLTMWPQNY